MMPWADVLRAGLVAVLAVLAASALRTAVGGRGRWPWALLLAPYLTPALLVGYAYSSFALSLIHYPALNAAWYAVLLWLRLAPVACLVLCFAPHPLTAAARHCRLLSHGTVDWRFRWQAGGGVAPVVAGALVFILAFGEFELASLLNIRSWTVRIFDGHAGGLPLAQSLRLAAGPFAIEAMVLALALCLLARHHWNGGLGTTGAPAAPSRRWLSVVGWCLLVAANLAVLLLPAVTVLHGTAQGWRVLAVNFALGREIVTSLAFGGVAALVAYALAPRRWWTALAVSTPGLLGPLVLALLLGAAVQARLLVPWRDTPVPLCLVLALLLLPPAVLLRSVLRRTALAAAAHAARLLGGRHGRQLLWQVSTRRHVWAIFLLFCWGYLDLTASAILAPVGMAPVSVRLYNLMHYGQTAVLSGMVTAAFAAPLVVLGLALASRRLWMRL